MRALSRFPTLLILLALASVYLFPTVASAVSHSEWVGDLYGNTELWGLGYSRPFTSSSHYILVSNESEFVAKYLYEFKASILQTGTEERFPANPLHVNINPDQVVVESRSLSINLNNIPQLENNDVFTLDCYTRIDLVTKFNGSSGWKVSLRQNYLK